MTPGEVWAHRRPMLNRLSPSNRLGLMAARGALRTLRYWSFYPAANTNLLRFVVMLGVVGYIVVKAATR